jgi:hypothetical protein
MSLTRWVTEPSAEAPLTTGVPSLPNLEVVYLTDPDALAEVLPPPLAAPPEPRVHVRITDIDLRFGDHRYKELVAYFAVDAVLDGEPGEYPLLIPIDLEHAVSISRERFGEPAGAQAGAGGERRGRAGPARPGRVPGGGPADPQKRLHPVGAALQRQQAQGRRPGGSGRLRPARSDPLPLTLTRSLA